MRLRHLVVGIVVGAAAIPAFATGATNGQLFLGGFEDQSDSLVRLKTGVSEGYHAKGFGAREFMVSCDGGIDAIMGRAAIRGRFPIGRKGGFHARDDNGKTVLNVRGTIEGRKAEGRFRYSGEVPDEQGNLHDCDSGRLEWEAKLEK